jgi:hypothetical protein
MQTQDVRILGRDVGVAAERRRIVGEILKQVGLRRLAGQESIADALDALVTVIEHPEMQP